MVPMNLEFVKDLWLPNIFIYNLKTYKVMLMIRTIGNQERKAEKIWDFFFSAETITNFLVFIRCLQVIDVLSKLAGLWIDTNKLILYSQSTHIRCWNILQ